MSTDDKPGNKEPRSSSSGNTRRRQTKSRSTPPLTPLQAHYLDLLQHRVGLRNSYSEDHGREEWMVKAIDKAVYAAYRSSAESGAEAEAKAILAGARHSN